jgi:predicted phage terminase large subunit-like protein
VPNDELEIARREIGSFLYSQEYLAEFVEAKGGIIHPEWFRYYQDGKKQVYDDNGYEKTVTTITTADVEHNTEDLRRITTVDLATSTKESADYTVVTTVGIAPNQDVFVLDVVRARLEAPQVLKLLQDVYDKWQPEVMGVERAGYQLAFVQIARQQTNLPIRELRADKDKVSRALPLSAKMEAGQVYFPKYADWYLDLEKELLQFPAGEHDDQVDSLAYAILQVARKREFRAY